MAVLTFSLSPENVGKLHDALVCLGKFHESVSFEATRDHVRHLNLGYLESVFQCGC